MNFKRVRKGYDPVQVEAFIKSREEQNNSIIENQQKIIDAQADEIKQLRQGKETATVGGAMLMDESRRAAVLKKCDIFSRTVDLFEKLVKSRLTEKEAGDSGAHNWQHGLLIGAPKDGGGEKAGAEPEGKQLCMGLQRPAAVQDLGVDKNAVPLAENRLPPGVGGGGRHAVLHPPRQHQAEKELRVPVIRHFMAVKVIQPAVEPGDGHVVRRIFHALHKVLIHENSFDFHSENSPVSGTIF